jgi:hypothetical protein
MPVILTVMVCHILFLASCRLQSGGEISGRSSPAQLRDGFQNPPYSARPGVYWYFMDGNLSEKEMTADLQSMKEAGIGNLIFLEVNVGVPRGPVDFLSGKWQELFSHAVHEAENLGIAITTGVGPGWTGSGGPWVKPEQSMQHLVARSTKVTGPAAYSAILPKPEPRRPFFGEEGFTEKLREQRESYYRDEFVLAFPTPDSERKIEDADEKALYYRAPYTSQPGVKPYLPAPAEFPDIPVGSAIQNNTIVDITSRLRPDGRIEWDVPPGDWTIMRFGSCNNGAITRPAPYPGLGLESNKFNSSDFDAHFNAYIGKLIEKVGPRGKDSGGGWTMLHMDSWEMGAQNWTAGFRSEFRKRRRYDPLPFFPAYTGLIVGNREMSERFLWDVRKTAQELVLEHHAGRIKTLGRQHGFGLSIEPYDMNPCADLDLGAVADVPMGEFWSRGFGFNSAFSCIEAASIAHVNGKPVVAAEAFTADVPEAWKLYPGAMKNQGDWAFCAGINRFVYHTFAHKAFGVEYRPGMTMGPYGVHWDRGQTWWPMVKPYHEYIARCSFLLQQGRSVADILFLTPEGAPQVFRPPISALAENDTIPDRRGYNFDGCSPGILMSKARVQGHQIVFPGGTSYRLLVLPAVETMTPELVDTIAALVKDGAIVVGTPPRKSPSLVDYPGCDARVRGKAEKLWGGLKPPDAITGRQYGKGKIYWGGRLSGHDASELYPRYETLAAIMKTLGTPGDFESSGSVRYTHRTVDGMELYFVANRTDQTIRTECTFRVDSGIPELWDPLNGEIRRLPEYSRQDGRTRIPLRFAAYQSYFFVFNKNNTPVTRKTAGEKNFPDMKNAGMLEGPWSVSFDPKWGGPETVTFEKLEDWTNRPEEGIRYYSGIAIYRKTFDLPETVSIETNSPIYLDLGEIHAMARVKLNGDDLGVVWTAPRTVNISPAVKRKGNHLEIDVANLWPNRLIGDEQYPDDGVKNGQWPEWLREGKERTSGRYTFTTHRFYRKDSPLLKSGLIGPVKIMSPVAD